MRKTIVSLIVAGMAISAFGADASAQTRRKHRKVVARPAVTEPVLAESYDVGSDIPLTVNRRSWLDVGNVVPRNNGALGGQSYVQANTILHQTQDRIFAPDGFGNDVIKGQPYIPGRSHPVIEGSILPNGQPVVDTALLPQNFYFHPAPSVP